MDPSVLGSIFAMFTHDQIAQLKKDPKQYQLYCQFYPNHNVSVGKIIYKYIYEG